ncbi:hypothetical protein [Stutzerimonas nitrititolerans]|uniref:hypothetical protein n=1 Tax=Stutzerimonas nitrititolerans TaxID=2482751 RepID=UPI0028AF3BBF|nr:hypothetical protein [Stutzerimonas nitrititolerans]
MSSKACVCGNTRLVKLTSQNLKICTDCKREIPWNLDAGQQPVYRPHRSDRKARGGGHGV